MDIKKHLKTVTYCAAARLLAGMFATFILGGCVESTHIKATDNFAFLPALRANINFGDRTQAASEPHTGHAIEFGVANAQGSDSQTLAPGQPPIFFNGTTFEAPQQLRNDFNTNFANISWRWRKFFAERSLGLEVTAGAGFSSLDLAVSSSTTAQRASDHFSSRGPQAGVGLIWRVEPGTSLQGRVSIFISPDFGVNSIARYELFFAKAFHDNLTLRAGFASWNVSGHGYSDSEFELGAFGPALALDWDINAGK